MERRIFQAMANETRREIIRLLKQKDMTAGEIASHFSISKPSISRHLDTLKNAGLIVPERKGNQISLRHQHDVCCRNGSGVSVSGTEKGGILS